MTRYDLFCMIFLALDADWDETHDEELGKYLSDANPFLFAGESSAVEDVYNAFCKVITNEDVKKEQSFKLAQKYVKSLNIKAVIDSFDLLKEEQWEDALGSYLEEKYGA